MELSNEKYLLLQNMVGCFLEYQEDMLAEKPDLLEDAGLVWTLLKEQGSPDLKITDPVTLHAIYYVAGMLKAFEINDLVAIRENGGGYGPDRPGEDIGS